MRPLLLPICCVLAQLALAAATQPPAERPCETEEPARTSTSSDVEPPLVAPPPPSRAEDSGGGPSPSACDAARRRGVALPGCAGRRGFNLNQPQPTQSRRRPRPPVNATRPARPAPPQPAEPAAEPVDEGAREGFIVCPGDPRCPR